ncbi:MAG TPA: Crp/Fnr family transcriptional regulator [Kofleriaceae bacterium]|nr:Crp/Fnr family transcriptional regulator [Kofleriaceae bacterium]
MNSCSTCEIGSCARQGRQACPYVPRERAAGELIYLEGEPAVRCWYVKRGTVALTRELDDDHGEGRVRAVRFPGSLVGLEALVGGHYMDSARAITDVTLCSASRATVDAWLGPRPSPARATLELALRTECFQVMRRAAPDGNAEKRLAAWLHGQPPEASTWTLPRRVAADLLGMRPETLSRALAGLARRGLIRVTRRRVDVVDAAGLATAAGHTDR